MKNEKYDKNGKDKMGGERTLNVPFKYLLF